MKRMTFFAKRLGGGWQVRPLPNPRLKVRFPPLADIFLLARNLPGPYPLFHKSGSRMVQSAFACTEFGEFSF
jgi:hypothetical protein